MTFNPNTDTNWAQVVAKLNVLSAEAQNYFLTQFAQYICNDVTNSTTINGAELTNAVTTAFNGASRAGERTF